MSRFKFRIWDPCENKMDGPYTIEEIADTSCIITDLYTGECLKKDLVFLRYTGFSDWNDNEIYEGDCIRPLKQEGPKGEVRFDTDDGMWVIAFDKGNQRYNLGKFLIASDERSIVCSNIYENPSLKDGG